MSKKHYTLNLSVEQVDTLRLLGKKIKRGLSNMVDILIQEYIDKNQPASNLDGQSNPRGLSHE